MAETQERKTMLKLVASGITPHKAWAMVCCEKCRQALGVVVVDYGRFCVKCYKEHRGFSRA